MKGQNIDQCPEPPGEFGEPVGIGIAIVHARDHHILERDPLAERRRRREHGLEVVLLLDGHDLPALGRGRGMQ